MNVTLLPLVIVFPATSPAGIITVSILASTYLSVNFVFNSSPV
nr:MAG TPA: hypothetical protein [Caudoviricetes sp.]